ncbi:hypothetical protein BH683_005495 [Williamsia sp. 1138]|uniref:DUF2254 domain-containing protein n=1 Tax=Williamsia sp. 1138 TaxID=1903117 RepID=UPI000A11E55F|nr:DUF2254 domain-containing protein [Williamsia sp. 1138]OZG30062.1 hypothetical protein BH683_005495 [Williamsia sp. 1138]
MYEWFDRTIVDTGRLPLFFLLVAFVLTFLFIRFSVRMIRAQVSWWPGNVTPGGVHMHHEFFGVIMMMISGFCFVALASFHTPIANCVLASIFGIGAALVLDEFALVLHLRDVYWEEEGRSSIDAVFVAIAVITLFLMGLRPFGFGGELNDYENAPDTVTRVVVIVALALSAVLATITLLKGKLWTGLIGLFFLPLLIIGSIRIGRPASPWARWRYTTRPGKREKAIRREQRYREPIVRWKIVVQEAVAGRFGIPDHPAPIPVEVAVREPGAGAPNRMATAIRWRRTRHRLGMIPVWRLPAVLVSLSILAALVVTTVDDTFVIEGMDAGSTSTLLGVIAGAMATLTGLVFTAITLAMQFGASQISVRVIPVLQQDPIMRWSIGTFLATFVFTLITALDIAEDSNDVPAPGLSTLLALLVTIASVFMFIALVVKVGSVLNSSQLLRWIANEGRGAIRRVYPVEATGDVGDELPVGVEPEPGSQTTLIQLREIPSQGRVLMAVDLQRLQRLAIDWNVRVDLLIGIGDFVAHNADVFEVHGPGDRVRPHHLLGTLLFGDTHRPSVSPAAALQSISDIALKALSPAINDPGRAVQALDHVEDLLLMLAPRLRVDQQYASLTLVGGYRRTWDDFVAVGTDEIRHYSSNAAQVQRRLRALLQTLREQCPPDQHEPIDNRLRALDEQLDRDWASSFDRWLAGAADRQGYGSEAGSSATRKRLIIKTPPRNDAPSWVNDK